MRFFKHIRNSFIPVAIPTIRARRRFLAGLTFAEVLVSTVILVLVLAEMLAGFAGGRLLSRRSRDRLIAQSFAREKLEGLLAGGYASVPVGESEDLSFTAGYANLEFLRRTGARRYFRADEFSYRGSPCYKRVTVVVKWKFLRDDVIHTESLSSLIYNPSYTPLP